MGQKDYIPSNDIRLLDWAKYLVQYSTLNKLRWKVPAPDNAIIDLLKTYDACLQKSSSPNRGKVDILEKNEAKKALVKAFRTYVQGFLAKNPFVTNADRESMGLTIHDVVPTPVADPTGQAEGQISYPGRTQLKLRIKHVDGTPLDAKANYGCRIYYDINAAGDTLPASGMNLHESRFTRRKIILFSFLPADSGKIAFFSIRYENSKGKAGPWGPLFSAVIP